MLRTRVIRTAKAGVATFLLGASAWAAPVGVDLGFAVDERGSYGLDADITVVPTDHLTFTAGASHSNAAEHSDITGTLLGAGASLHGRRGGLSLAYDRFDDSSNYQAGTLAARAWVAAGDFELTLLARRRDLEVELTLQLPLRVMRRKADFSATGTGLSLAWANESLNLYAMALEYDYDGEFDEFIGLIGSPLLTARPRIEALVASFISQAQGVIDAQVGAGAELAFGRHSVALDVSRVHDAVLESDSTSVSLTYRNVRSARLDWSLSSGLAHSDTYGDIAFVGFGIGLAAY